MQRVELMRKYYTIIRLRFLYMFFFFQAEDGIRDVAVTGVQTCALPISAAGRATDDIEGKVMIMWSLFHGFFALLMTGRIPMESRDRVRALATQAVDSLLIAWRSGQV